MRARQRVDLGESVLRDGFEAHGAALEQLASRARADGVVPAAAELLVDGSAPEVLRQRALFVVLRELARPARCAPPLELRASHPVAE